MIEDGVAEVLRHDRLGHQMPGIQATYSHMSQPMRGELKRALQGRWETALGERAAMCPRSPLPILDRILAARRPGALVPSPKYLPRWEKAPLPERGERASDLGRGGGI